MAEAGFFNKTRHQGLAFSLPQIKIHQLLTGNADFISKFSKVAGHIFINTDSDRNFQCIRSIAR